MVGSKRGPARPEKAVMEMAWALALYGYLVSFPVHAQPSARCSFTKPIAAVSLCFNVRNLSKRIRLLLIEEDHQSYQIFTVSMLRASWNAPSSWCGSMRFFVLK